MEGTIPAIQIAEFAEVWENWELIVTSWMRETQMKHSDWTARALLLHKKFWADEIRFGAWEWVWTHTHEWDHILMVTKWTWFVEYDWVDYPLEPGSIYMVPWSVEHAIKATTELILIAIANDHRPAGSEERLDVVVK